MFEMLALGEMCFEGMGQCRLEVRGLTLRVLRAFPFRRVNSWGQVISSPPGPCGGPFMTHLLPGGGVPSGSGGSEPCPSPASPFRHSLVSVSLSNRGCARSPTTPPP